MTKILLPLLLLPAFLFGSDTYSEYPISGLTKNQPAQGTRVDGKNIIELNVNNDDLLIGAKFDMGQYFANTFKPNMAYAGVNYYRFGSDKTQEMFQITTLAKDFLNASKGVKIGFGIKPTIVSYNQLTVENETLFAIPVGIEGEVFLPTENLFPISITASAYYAPKPLSFADAESYLDSEIRINAQVLSHIKAYIGYRTIQGELRNSLQSNQLNNSAFGGLSINF